jgi:hypothetical protein
MNNEMRDESPFISMEEVERPLSADREDMWDALVDLCQTDADFEAVEIMYDQATSLNDEGEKKQL